MQEIIDEKLYLKELENIKLLDEIKKHKKEKLKLKKNIRELKAKYILEIQQNDELKRKIKELKNER